MSTSSATPHPTEKNLAAAETKTPESLADLVNEAIFMSTEAQQFLEQVVHTIADRWNVDFSEDPHLTLGEGAETLRLAPSLIGSRDANYDSWRWGWSDDNDWTGPVVELAHELRKTAARVGIPELTDPEFNASEDEALRLTLAAKRLTGHWAHFPLPLGPTVVWLLVDGQELELPEPTIRSVVKALASGLTITDVSDHWAALGAYARLRGFGLVPLPAAEGDGPRVRRARILTADGYADTEFDDKHRLVKCNVHQPLAGDALTQYEELSAERSSETPAPAEAEVQPEPETQPEPVAQPVPAEAEMQPTPATQPEPAPTPHEKPQVTDTVTESGAETAPDVKRAPESTPAAQPATVSAAQPAADTQKPKEKKGFFQKLFGR